MHTHLSSLVQKQIHDNTAAVMAFLRKKAITSAVLSWWQNVTDYSVRYSPTN